MPADLARKLLLKDTRTARMVNAPPGVAQELGVAATGESPVSWLLVFVPDSAALDAALDELKAVPPGGVIWVAYRKGGAAAGTDLNRDIIWRRLEPEGLAGVTLVAIDDEWSAMRFRRPDEVGT
jgi:hypothetical protein